MKYLLIILLAVMFTTVIGVWLLAVWHYMNEDEKIEAEKRNENSKAEE